MTEEKLKELAFKVLEDVVENPNAEPELKEKAREALKERDELRKVRAEMAGRLPDGDPVHEAAKAGAGAATTDTAG